MKISELHKRAKQFLQEKGWCKGTYKNPDGALCLVGAYLEAGREIDNGTTYDQVREDLGLRETRCISAWNDYPSTNLDMVFERLDKAIETATAREAGEV